MGVLSEEDFLKGGIVSPEREELTSKERFQQIIDACCILRREGYGNVTPNHLTHIIANTLQRRE